MVPEKDGSAETGRLTGLVRGAAILPIRAYKLFVSPLLAPACRFQPSCSDYAREAIGRYGPVRGSWLALRRLLRCHPFSGRHGHDPVP